MIRFLLIIFFSGSLLPAYAQKSEKETFLVVLGTIQDAGVPHIACKKECCQGLFENPDAALKVVSLGIVDTENEKNWLIEATPDMAAQMKMLQKESGFEHKETPDGVLLTHAHIGHYTGLMYFGKEAMNAKSVVTYAMPRLKKYLETNGPWSQLVELNNITLEQIRQEQIRNLSSNISFQPILVPHRDEYSETVGYKIAGPNKSALFIPDIDKWSKWDKHIIEEIRAVDYAFLDATFFDGSEINHRDISQIPHPFVIESMELFRELPESDKAKVYFIHLNHTNPLIDKKSKAYQSVIENGFHVAELGMKFGL